MIPISAMIFRSDLMNWMARSAPMPAEGIVDRIVMDE